MATTNRRSQWLGKEIEDALAQKDATSIAVVGWLLAFTDLSDQRQHEIIKMLARRDAQLADVVNVQEHART